MEDNSNGIGKILKYSFQVDSDLFVTNIWLIKDMVHRLFKH